MKHIKLDIILTDDLGIHSVVFDQNDTELKSDSKLIEKIAVTLIKSTHLNKDSLIVQDMLNELNIGISDVSNW